MRSAIAASRATPVFVAALLSLACSAEPTRSCSWDYFCRDYVAGFSEEMGRAACDEEPSPSTFSSSYRCEGQGAGGVRRVAYCTITSPDGGNVTRLHHYAYSGAMTATEFEAAFCPGPTAMTGWSFDLHVD